MPEDNAQDLAGYGSVEDLVKGYRNSSDEAKRQKSRADQLEQRAALLEQQTRQSVPQRNDPSTRLADYGVPVDSLDEYIGSKIAAAFEPITRGALARNTLAASYPDYLKFEADVAKFVQEDPQLSQSYQKMFGADPVGAMELAFLKYGESQRQKAGSNGKTPQQAARSEAQIPSNRQGDARTQPASTQDENLNRGWDHFQKTGDPRAFAKARLRQVVSDEFLNR